MLCLLKSPKKHNWLYVKVRPFPDGLARASDKSAPVREGGGRGPQNLVLEGSEWHRSQHPSPTLLRTRRASEKSKRTCRPTSPEPPSSGPEKASVCAVPSVAHCRTLHADVLQRRTPHPPPARAAHDSVLTPQPWRPSLSTSQRRPVCGISGWWYL